MFWYIAIFKNKIRFSLNKLQLLSFLKKVFFGMILFLNGNKKRKNPIKLPFLIELHSRGQSGEFRNVLVHCNLQKKIKFRWKTQIIDFFEKLLFGMILFLNGNKKRKNRRKLRFVIELHSRGQSGEFRNFLVHCNLQKKIKFLLKNSNYWVFWKDVIWHDTVPNR